MKIFISHSSKNKEIVLKFAEFLENVSTAIEVFCSSEKRAIKVGTDFIEKIFQELDDSSVFIPIISKEYYDSKFSMIELGVAYSYLCEKYKKNGENYIFPLVLYPIQKDYALSGTPLGNLQIGEITDEEDLRGLLEYIAEDKNVHIGSGTNQKIHAFVNDIDNILLKNKNVLENAKINTFFDDSIEFNRQEDIAHCSVNDTDIVVNFNLNPYERENVKKPNFVSLVLGYVDKLDMGRYLELDAELNFEFTITSFTNSLRRIFVEFKYSDNNRILDTFEFPIKYGKNNCRVPLTKMQSKALKNISEICFVVHPDDVVEDEGMYKISEIKISN